MSNFCDTVIKQKAVQRRKFSTPFRRTALRTQTKNPVGLRAAAGSVALRATLRPAKQAAPVPIVK